MNYNIIANANTITNYEWLELRKKGIGGSEIAGILGYSPWQTPLSIYIDKTTDEIEPKESEAMEWGKTLEPIIRQKFPKKFKESHGVGLLVEEFPYMMCHKDYSFILANIDGKVTPETDFTYKIQLEDGTFEEVFFKAGETGGLEIKRTSGFNAKQWKGNELPTNYFLQTQYYMGVTGYKYFWVVALIDSHLVWKYIPRDQELIDMLFNAAKNFWTNHVLANVPPEPIGAEVDGECLNKLYPAANPETTIDINALEKQGQDCLNVRALWAEFKRLGEQKKEIDEKQELIKQKLAAFMQDKETLLIDKKKVTYKVTSGKEKVIPAWEKRILRVW